MSPEQMLGKPVDQRSDIFSVGSVAYELLCYQQAFKGNLNDGLLHRLPHEDPPLLKELNPAIPLAIEQVVMRALEKDPGRRYQNLTDMRTALVNAHAAGRQSAAPAPRPVEDERTVVVARPKTSPPVPVPAPAPAGYAGSLSPKPATPPAAPEPLSEIHEPHSQMAYVPPAVGLKLKSEAIPPAPTPAIERPAPPPRSVPPPAANIAIAPSPPSVPRRTATVAPTPQAQSSSKKWILIGAVVAVLTIGAAAAALLSGRFNPPPEDPAAVERPRIIAAMADYRSAYRNRDLAGVVKVFPELPADTRRAMEQTFTNCLVYEVQFGNIDVGFDASDPNNATVEVRSTHTCTPNSGGRQTNASHHDMFSLKKMGDTWLIASAAPVSASGPQ
jgi:hypothetical protein